MAAAAGNHFYPQLKEHLGKDRLLIIVFVATLVSTIFSPIFGLMLGGAGILLRHFFYTIPDVISSDTINKSVDSKYRATTLSTFVMLHNIPYVASAYFVGSLIDKSSASLVTMWVAIVFLILTALVYLKRQTSFSGK